MHGGCAGSHALFATDRTTQESTEPGVPPRSPEEVTPEPLGACDRSRFPQLTLVHSWLICFSSGVQRCPRNSRGLVLTGPNAQETPQEAAYAYWALAGMHASIAAPHFIFPEEASTTILANAGHNIAPEMAGLVLSPAQSLCLGADGSWVARRPLLLLPHST